MRNRLFVLVLLGFLAIGLPMTVAALGIDVEAKAGAGIGLGATDNPSITGAARFAAGGGVGVDLYLLTIGSINLGVSVGAEYSYLTFHSVWSNFQFPGEDQTTDATYNYIDVPIALVASMPISSSIRLVVRGGAFIGYFLSGSANNTYSLPAIPNNTTTLDSSNTIQMEYGLHFTAGTDIALGGSLSIAPALQFDMGLSDTTVNGPIVGNFNDRIWGLTLMVGIKYKVM